MEPWVDFATVGVAALILFIICAFWEKRAPDAPRLLLIGIVAGIPLGLLSDFVLWGTYNYPLGYGLLYLTINAAVIYGLFVATILLLQRVRLLHFSAWIVAVVAVYEGADYLFPVWAYKVTPFLGWLSFILIGYFATAFFIALVAHLLFRYRFQFINDVI
jgi:hypothetical protein